MSGNQQEKRDELLQSKIKMVQFWDTEEIVPLFTGLKLAPGTAEHYQLVQNSFNTNSEGHNPSGLPLYEPSFPFSAKSIQCSHCKTTFVSREEQVAHYSKDWHHFNLKRSVDGLASVSEKRFLHNADDDSDELSSEDNEEDFDEDYRQNTLMIRKQPRIFFVNSDQQVLSVYRSVLHDKKTEPSTEQEMIHRVNSAINKVYWVIFLIGGGHFAGAVFKGSEIILHKTFHSYTVRSKQGGSQSSRDNKSATSHPRSAGSSLRRYNESVHAQHIQDIIVDWAEHLVNSDLLFIRCPKNLHYLLFDGQTPTLTRLDQRLRKIPFSTKKATFAEVKKVHKLLSQIIVHGKLDDILQIQTKDNAREINVAPKSSPGSKKNCKSKDKLSMNDKAARDTLEKNDSTTESEEDCDGDLVTEFEHLTTDHLNPFGSTVEDMRKAKKILLQNNEENDSQETVPLDLTAKNAMRKIENVAYTCCRTGKLNQLIATWEFSKKKDITDVSDTLSSEVIEALLSLEEGYDMLSMKVGLSEKSLLHVAAENCQKDVVWWLLQNGCDPTNRNNKNETPYAATKSRETRNHFRRYMAAYPNQYNYEKASIPGPLTKAMEAETKAKLKIKKKEQKNSKLKKERQFKMENELRNKEEENKRLFLQLSDREKRALAAESRITSQSSQQKGNVPSSVLRCFQCAKDITKLVPFEYLEFKFCSTSCVKEHRTNNKTL